MDSLSPLFRSMSLECQNRGIYCMNIDNEITVSSEGSMNETIYVVIVDVV